VAGLRWILAEARRRHLSPEAFELIVTGAVRVAELCSHRLPLERLEEAARLMERREALKVYIEVDTAGGGMATAGGGMVR